MKAVVDIIILMTVIFLIIFWIVNFFTKRSISKKSNELSSLAKSRDYSFKYLDDEVENKFYSYKLSTKYGSQGRPRYIIRAKIDNIDVILFEYFYYVATGRKRGGHYENVILFSTTNTPDFILRPRELSDRLRFKSSRQFKTHLRFSSKYIFHAEKTSQAKSFFTDKALTYFSENSGHQIETINNTVAIIWTGKKKPIEYLNLIDDSLSLWHNIKPSLSSKARKLIYTI